MANETKVSVAEMLIAIADADPLEDTEVALLAASDYIASANKVLGPSCPKCGHWLKVEHGRSFNPPTRKTNFYCEHRDGKDQRECEFPIAELLADYPDIAREM